MVVVQKHYRKYMRHAIMSFEFLHWQQTKKVFVLYQTCIGECDGLFLGVVNLYRNALLFPNSRTHLICSNLQINQSANSINDHPKMPRLSKKANLLKDLEAVAFACSLHYRVHLGFDWKKTDMNLNDRGESKSFSRRAFLVYQIRFYLQKIAIWS